MSFKYFLLKKKLLTGKRNSRFGNWKQTFFGLFIATLAHPKRLHSTTGLLLFLLFQLTMIDQLYGFELGSKLEILM